MSLLQKSVNHWYRGTTIENYQFKMKKKNYYIGLNEFLNCVHFLSDNSCTRCIAVPPCLDRMINVVINGIWRARLIREINHLKENHTCNLRGWLLKGPAEGGWRGGYKGKGYFFIELFLFLVMECSIWCSVVLLGWYITYWYV